MKKRRLRQWVVNVIEGTCLLVGALGFALFLETTNAISIEVNGLSSFSLNINTGLAVLIIGCLLGAIWFSVGGREYDV